MDLAQPERHQRIAAHPGIVPREAGGVEAVGQEREHQVVVLAGDGDFMMTGQEIATAFHHGVAPIILVFNNQMFGTIRMHQERTFPGRVSGTRLVNPDFAALAESHGALGITVDANDAFAPALDRALAFLASERRPALMVLKVDPRIITPSMLLAE